MFLQGADLQLKFTARCLVFNLVPQVLTVFWRLPSKAKTRAAPASPELSLFPGPSSSVSIHSSQRQGPVFLV